MSSPLLKIDNLAVSVKDHKIIKDLSFSIKSGEMHALMGPNGSGKTTLAYSILGHPNCLISSGKILFKGENITNWSTAKRSKLGLFLAFQQPITIPGLQVFTFLKEIFNAFTQEKISLIDFHLLVKRKMAVLDIDESFLLRNVNEDFSGGEKKKFEMLQLLLLNPSLAIIDEIDSGLDIDAIKIISDAINLLRIENPAISIILVSHYQTILRFLKPDFVHIIVDGKIIKSGDYKLSKSIEKDGYCSLKNERKGNEICL